MVNSTPLSVMAKDLVDLGNDICVLFVDSSFVSRVLGLLQSDDGSSKIPRGGSMMGKSSVSRQGTRWNRTRPDGGRWDT